MPVISNGMPITIHLIGKLLTGNQCSHMSNIGIAIFLPQPGWEINRAHTGRFVQRADKSAFVGKISRGDHFAVVRTQSAKSRVVYSELEAWQLVFDNGIVSRIRRYVKSMWRLLCR